MKPYFKNVSVPIRESNNEITNRTVKMVIYKGWGIYFGGDFYSVNVTAGKFEGYHVAGFKTLKGLYIFLKILNKFCPDTIKLIENGECDKAEKDIRASLEAADYIIKDFDICGEEHLTTGIIV